MDKIYKYVVMIDIIELHRNEKIVVKKSGKMIYCFLNQCLHICDSPNNYFMKLIKKQQLNI